MLLLGLTLPQWAAIFTIMGVVISLLKPVRQWFAKIWRSTFGRQSAQLDRIEKELRPNGGDSLRDAIDEIYNKQTEFEARATAALNIHPEAVFRTDTEGRVIFTNRAHQRLTGFSQGEAYGHGWVNYLAPYERRRMQDLWQETVKNGRELNEDIMFIRPDHSEYMIRAHVFREVDGAGKIRGYLGVIQPLEEANHPKHECIQHFRDLVESDYAKNGRKETNL